MILRPVEQTVEKLIILEEKFEDLDNDLTFPGAPRAVSERILDLESSSYMPPCYIGLHEVDEELTVCLRPVSRFGQTFHVLTGVRFPTKMKFYRDEEILEHVAQFESSRDRGVKLEDLWVH